jgi:hypothetical protein
MVNPRLQGGTAMRRLAAGAITLTLCSLVTVRRLATAHAGPTVAEPAAAPVD